MAADHKKRAHALLSASGASRWMSCTPSARLEDDVANEDSVFAAEGTLAHEFAEIELILAYNDLTNAETNIFKRKMDKDNDRKKYAKRLAKLEANELYIPEMDEYVAVYVDYVMALYSEAYKADKGSILAIEDRVDLTAYIEDGFGSNDAMIIADGVLDVSDLKYGKGVPVSAEENAQLMLYGLGAYYKHELSYDIHTIRLTIVQPRLDSVSVWDISVEDLVAWGENVVKPKAVLAYAGEGETVPGDHCRFCRVKPRCRALADQNLALAKHEFKEPALLDDEEVLEVYAQVGNLVKWADSVKNFVLKSALGGKKWDGLKLVSGRANRAWIDPDATLETLKGLKFKYGDIQTTKIKGIGAIEKLMGKVSFSEFSEGNVHKPPGSITLAPSSDKRPEIQMATAEDDFKD